MMKAGILFTGSGPILMLTSYKSFSEDRLIEKLRDKGIRKFICYEVPVDLVIKKYGNHYEVILGDLRQTDDLRVVDYDGSHVFSSFSFKELGEPTYHE
jgi:hypothetical protein